MGSPRLQPIVARRAPRSRTRAAPRRGRQRASLLRLRSARAARHGLHADVDAKAVAALLAALPRVRDVASVVALRRDQEVLARDGLDDDLALRRRSERVIV